MLACIQRWWSKEVFFWVRIGEKDRLKARRSKEVSTGLFQTSDGLLMTIGSGDIVLVLLLARKEIGNGEVRNG